jgi:hypothetical protein
VATVKVQPTIVGSVVHGNGVKETPTSTFQFNDFLVSTAQSSRHVSSRSLIAKAITQLLQNGSLRPQFDPVDSAHQVKEWIDEVKVNISIARGRIASVAGRMCNASLT